MAASFWQMRDVLDALELKYHADEQHQWFHLPYARWAITIDFTGDGAMFRTRYLAQLQSFDQPVLAMGRLLAENSRLKVGQYIVAPDGEIAASSFMLALADHEPTTAEVRRTLEALCGLSHRFADVVAGRTLPWGNPAGTSDDELAAGPGTTASGGAQARDDATSEPPAALREMFEQLFDDVIDDATVDGEHDADDEQQAA